MRQRDLFTALQSSTEGIDTEFKSARGGMPGSFWVSYAAQLRTVDDEGRQFVLVNAPLRLITRESGNSEKIFINQRFAIAFL